MQDQKSKCTEEYCGKETCGDPKCTCACHPTEELIESPWLDKDGNCRHKKFDREQFERDVIALAQSQRQPPQTEVPEWEKSNWYKYVKTHTESFTSKQRDKIFDIVRTVLALELATERNKCEQERYCSPCVGCQDGHPSFWKTIVESKEWDSWRKEHARRWHEHVQNKDKEFTGCFDIDESQECGWLGVEHWNEFIGFLLSEEREKVLEELGDFLDGMGMEGKNGCTYGDTRHDAAAVAYGFNEAVEQFKNFIRSKK